MMIVLIMIRGTGIGVLAGNRDRGARLERLSMLNQGKRASTKDGRGWKMAMGGSRTPHYCPHTGDQVDRFGLHAGAVVGGTEARFSLCPTPSN